MPFKVRCSFTKVAHGAGSLPLPRNAESGVLEVPTSTASKDEVQMCWNASLIIFATVYDEELASIWVLADGHLLCFLFDGDHWRDFF